jgi:RNA polymerase sigma-70 factor (ECF subfamily)
VSDAAFDKDFKGIVHEYGGYVHTLCYHLLWDRHDAEDAAQETFLKVFQNWSRYDKTKGLKNWICTIALNAARDIYRNRKLRRERTAADGSIETAPDRNDLESSIDDRQQIEYLLAELDMKSRSVIVLFYMEQMSIEEIARVLKKPGYLIKVWLHRARKAMLARAGGIEE